MKKSKLIGAVVILLLLGTVMAGAAAADPLTGISLDKHELNIGVGDYETLKVATTPEEPTGEISYTWSSSDASIATVESGTVLGVGNGVAVITVTAVSDNNQFYDSCTVTVGLLSISFNNDKINLSVNQSTDLTVTTDPNDFQGLSYTWSSSDANVATVDQSGHVTGKSNGTVTISATTTYAGTQFEAQCLVTVGEAAGYTVTYVSTTYGSGINATWYNENTYETELQPNTQIQSGVSSGTNFTVTYYQAENSVQISDGTTAKNIYLGYNGAKFTGTPKISVSSDGAKDWSILNNGDHQFSVTEDIGINLKVENGNFLTIDSPDGVTLNAYVNGGATPITSGTEVTYGSSVVIKPTDIAANKSIKTMDIKNTYTSEAFTGSITKDVNGWYYFSMPEYSLTVSCILTGGGKSTVTYKADPTYEFTIPSDITLKSAVNGKVGCNVSITPGGAFSSDRNIVMRLDTMSDAVTKETPQTTFAVHSSTDDNWASNGKYAEYTMSVYDDSGLTTFNKKISDNQTTAGDVNNIIVEVTEGSSSSVTKYVGFTTTKIPSIVDADYTGTLTFTVGVEQISS